jgi:hypothetical protein
MSTPTRGFARRSVRAAILMLLVFFGSPAGAQELQPPRPYQGLFGGADTNRRQRLEVTWATLGSYDDNVMADAPGGSDPRFQLNGTSGTAAATLGYAARSRHASFTASGTVTGRYYPDIHKLTDYDGAGNATFAIDVNDRTAITASQGVRDQPYYQLGFVTSFAPSQPPPASSPSSAATRDSALSRVQSQAYDGRVQISERVGTRSALTASYAYRQTRFDDNRDPFRWQLANGSLGHHLTKYATLRVGYGYGQEYAGVRAGDPPVVTQNIDLGVDYARPLSASRRTRLAFASGSTVISYQGDRFYRLLADASLTRELGRTWNASVAYHRGIQFVERFAAPLYADNMQLHLTGFLSRRIDVSASGVYSNGQIGLSTTDSGYVTYSGIADLNVALARMLSVHAQYFYYHYDFDRAAALPFGVPSTLNRGGIRFGLSGWLPLLR